MALPNLTPDELLTTTRTVRKRLDLTRPAVDGPVPPFSRGGSLFPAVWSFMLAARLRGLGTAWTTLHLRHEREAAHLLGIPFDTVSQGCLIPAAYSQGTNFKKARRAPLDTVLHFNGWAQSG